MMNNKLFLSTVLAIVSPALSASTLTAETDEARITVSGISSGAAMAQQLHIAYPEIFSGAGLIAGVPFGCAQGSLTTAMTRCMGSVSEELPVAEFAGQIRSAANDGRLGDIASLSDDPVWVFHGTHDQTVVTELSTATVALYGEFLGSEKIEFVNNVEAGHNFPTSHNGTECSATEPPFIGRCNYDAAGHLLKHLYGDLDAPSTEIKTELIKTTLPGALAAGLNETAYLYTPNTCSKSGQSCNVHLVLHGCAQSVAQINMVFIEQSGYLPWADSNNIVLAFPQVAPSATNPYACWDWWGYTGDSYRWRDGAQMKVLADWVQGLTTG
jgi:poly(3-hydroxybutyrate) depolymerase